MSEHQLIWKHRETIQAALDELTRYVEHRYTRDLDFLGTPEDARWVRLIELLEEALIEVDELRDLATY